MGGGDREFCAVWTWRCVHFRVLQCVCMWMCSPNAALCVWMGSPNAALCVWMCSPNAALCVWMGSPNAALCVWMGSPNAALCVCGWAVLMLHALCVVEGCGNKLDATCKFQVWLLSPYSSPYTPPHILLPTSAVRLYACCVNAWFQYRL